MLFYGRKCKTKKTNQSLRFDSNILLFAKAFIKRYNDEKCIQLMSPGRKKKKKSSVYDSIVKNPQRVRVSDARHENVNNKIIIRTWE